MQDDSVLSFKSIFLYLKKALPIILITMIVSVIIGVIILSATSSATVIEETQAVIELTFEGADNGVDINGNRFDKNSLKSIEKVTAALEKTDSAFSPSEIRENISIESKYSSTIQNILNNSADPDAIIKLLESNNLVPTQFVLRLNYNKVKGLNKETSQAIIEQLIEINRSEYKDAIESTQFIDLEIYDKCADYSFAEFDSTLRLQLLKLKGTAIDYNINSSSNKLVYIEQLLVKLENYVLSNNAFNAEEKAQLTNFMQSDYEYYNSLAQTAAKNADSIKLIIQEYDIPVTVKPDGTIVQIEFNSAQYDKMFDLYNSYIIKSNELSAVAKIINDKITLLNGLTPTANIDSSVVSAISEKRGLILSEIKAAAADLKTAQNEILNSGIDNDGIKIVMSPVNVKSSLSNTRNLVINVLIMLIVGFIGGLIIYKITEVIVKGIKNKRNGNNNGNVVLESDNPSVDDKY